MSEADLILIDAYLEGSMDEAARKVFEERLKVDTQFRARLEIVKESARAVLIETKDFNLVLNEVADQYHKRNDEKRSVSKTRLIFILSVAAGLLFLLMIGYYFRTTLFEASNPQILFAKNFERYPNNITVRGGLESNRSTQEQALFLYMRNLDDEAIVLFETLLSNNPTDTVHFFCGISYLYTHTPDAAIQQFMEMGKYEGSIYAIPARWYLALALLYKEDISESRKILEDLSLQKEDEVYAAKAKILLNKLHT